MSAPAPLGPRRTSLALGLVSGVTVAYEVLLSRLLSVTTWYSLAFAVLSLAMLGLTYGAIRAFRARQGPPLTPEWLARRLVLFATTLAGAGLLTTFVPIWFHVSVSTVAAFALVAAADAVPFVVGGELVARLLSSDALPVSTLYAVDLACAAAGALCPLALLGPLGATGAILALAAAAALGAALSGRAGAAWALAALLLASATATRVWPDRFRPAFGAKLGSLADLSRPLFERWNALSYVVAPRLQAVTRPYLWSQESAPFEGHYDEAMALVGGEAGTAILGYRSLADIDYLRRDVTAAAHALRPDGVACVIGVGGGRDALAALEAGHERVVATDINPAIVEMLRAVTAVSPLAADPRVELRVADGRQLFGREPAKCRVLQASLVDTWAATGAGAFAHTEATLYTREAWSGFLRAVEPDGVLTFSRWYGPTDVNETSRLVALAVAALLDRGVQRPEAHLALVSAGKVATLLVSPAPLSAADVTKLTRFAEEGGYRLLLAPGQPAPTPLLEKLVSAPTVEALAAAGEPEDLDTSAPSDDRPFFFHLLEPRAWLRPGAWGAWWGKPAGLIAGNVRSGLVLLLTVGVLFALAAALLAPTLVASARVGTRPLGARASLYFAALGAGFMLAEVALVQRMHLVLSHPTLALVFVLAGLLFAMGAGSFLSPRVLKTRARVGGWAAGVAALLAVLPAAVIAPLARLTQTAELPVRVAWVFGCSAGLGALAGMLFPAGLEFVDREAGTPMALALNGSAGVVGGSLAVAISVWEGIPATFFAAAALYGVAALVSPWSWPSKG